MSAGKNSLFRKLFEVCKDLEYEIIVEQTDFDIDYVLSAKIPNKKFRITRRQREVLDKIYSFKKNKPSGKILVVFTEEYAVVCTGKSLFQVVYKHTYTNRQIRKLILQNDNECVICYEDRNEIEYMICNVCSNMVCRECGEKIDQCPICRSG